MAGPLVSVIMPCFNAGPMLAPSLQSVFDQVHPEIEIVFVDNNSTDGSPELARRMLEGQSRPFRLARCPVRGANPARNLGYGLARGDYIQWMDADDRLDPEKIALQVAALESSGPDDIAYGDWSLQRSGSGPQAPLLRRLQQLPDQRLRTLAGVWYPPHLYLLRRAAAQRLQDLQAWRPDRAVATDVEYSAIAALIGLRFRYVEGAHVVYNVWSDDQISGRTPYPARVAALAAIFERLREIARSQGSELSPRHRTLLNQNWGIWRIAQQALRLARLPGRQFQLEHLLSGARLELRPREAAVAKALMATSRGLATCHHALLLAESVPEVSGDHPVIVELLERLQQAGFMEPEPASQDGPAPA